MKYFCFHSFWHGVERRAKEKAIHAYNYYSVIVIQNINFLQTCNSLPAYTHFSNKRTCASPDNERKSKRNSCRTKKKEEKSLQILKCKRRQKKTWAETMTIIQHKWCEVMTKNMKKKKKKRREKWSAAETKERRIEAATCEKKCEDGITNYRFSYEMCPFSIKYECTMERKVTNLRFTYATPLKSNNDKQKRKKPGEGESGMKK